MKINRADLKEECENYIYELFSKLNKEEEQKKTTKKWIGRNETGVIATRNK